MTDQRAPERWARNPIRPDECPHCQEYDWPEVWQLHADYDRVVEELEQSSGSWSEIAERLEARAEAAEAKLTAGGCKDHGCQATQWEVEEVYWA